MTLDPATFAWACAAVCAACAAPDSYGPAVWHYTQEAFTHQSLVRGRRDCRCDATVLLCAWADAHETAWAVTDTAQIGLGL